MEASYYEKTNDGTVHCLLCPHHCQIKTGQRGRCQIRANHNGVLTAAGYGKIASIAIDPIEKKPLNRFFPGSSILTVGGYGCNFHCSFCQNHEISQHIGPAPTYTPGELRDLAQAYSGDGNIGLAFSYNEPLISYEFVRDCAGEMKKAGLHTILVSNGYIEEAPFRALLPGIAAMNIDLKSFEDSFYRRYCGGSVEPVKRSIRLAAEHCHLEITTLIIPGLNDSLEEIRNIAAFIRDISPDIPLHISRFFPRYHMKDREPPGHAKMVELGEAAGDHLHYIYWGNM